jgi:hypothetical protein
MKNKPEQRPSRSARYLQLASTVLTLGEAIVTVATDVVKHFEKPKAAKNSRTKTDSALLGLTIVRSAPNVIRSLKRVASDFKYAKE